MPTVRALACEYRQDQEFCESGEEDYYCVNNEGYHHYCKWIDHLIFPDECVTQNDLILTCTKKEECSSDHTQLCKYDGGCAIGGPDFFPYCKKVCVDCSPGVCVDKNPFGPGCVTYPQTGIDTTSSSFYNLANIKNSLRVFLFPLLGLFILIVILVFFVLKQKKGKRRKK